jgi:hypothetical protein
MFFEPRLATQLRNIVSTDSDPATRGWALEQLVGYLLTTLAHYEVRLRVRHIDGEMDLLARRGFERHPLHVDLGRYMFVECKALEGPADSGMMKKFAFNARFGGCSTALMVSWNGFTGSKQSGTTAAWLVARKLYHRDSVILLLLDAADINRIVDRRASMLDALSAAYERMRFDLPR